MKNKNQFLEKSKNNELNSKNLYTFAYILFDHGSREKEINE